MNEFLEALGNDGGECDRRKSLRAVAVECLGTGMMVVVLKLLETTAWPRGRLRMPGSKHKARYVIRASCLLGIVLAQGGANI